MSSAPRVLPLESTGSRVGAGMVALILFSLGHFCVDLYSGALGILQPFIVARYGLTLTQAGVLGGVLVFSSSVTQPVYGYLSDRYRSRLFSSLGPALAGVFICAVCLAPSYGWALVLMVLGGVGVSAFHPQATAWAAVAMKRNQAHWMAVFISAGTLGIALAPAVFKEVVTRLGFDGVIWACIPGVLMSMFVLMLVRRPAGLPAGGGGAFDWVALKAVWKPLTILYLGVFFRSAVQVTYQQFLALYLYRERQYSLHDAAYLVTCYLTAGAVGGFVGGRLTDRYGAKRVIVLSFGLSFPFMAAFFLTRSAAGVVSLIIGGFILLFTIPVNVLLAQRLVPSQAGTVSALLMGFAWGASGMIFIPLTGWVSDHFSIGTALSALLVFPVLGCWLTRKLPEGLST